MEHGSVVQSGLADWSCMLRSVKGGVLVCTISTVKLIP